MTPTRHSVYCFYYRDIRHKTKSIVRQKGNGLDYSRTLVIACLVKNKIVWYVYGRNSRLVILFTFLFDPIVKFSLLSTRTFYQRINIRLPISIASLRNLVIVVYVNNIRKRLTKRYNTFNLPSTGTSYEHVCILLTVSTTAFAW